MLLETLRKEVLDANLELVRRGLASSKISVLCCPTDMRLFDLDLRLQEREEIRSKRGLEGNLLVMFVGAIVDNNAGNCLARAVLLA